MKSIYWGIFVQDDRLSKTLENPIQHMHVTFGFQSEIPTDILGNTVDIEVIGYACDGKNEAYSVKLPEAYKKYFHNNKRKPHITTSVAQYAKPVNSNKLDFKPIKPFTIKGKFGFFADDRTVYYA